MGQQQFHPPAQGFVARAGFRQEGRAPAFLALKSGVVELLHLLPALRVHACVAHVARACCKTRSGDFMSPRSG
jgi:hypothetical protein